MGQTNTGKYVSARVLPSSEGVITSTKLLVPDGDSTTDLSAFKSLTGMADAGGLSVQINGQEFVIPIVKP